jgi:hypothetical protein
VDQKSADDGPGLLDTGTLRIWRRRGDADPAPDGGAGAGAGGEAGGARVRATRTRKGGISAEDLARLRRSDALIADTRVLLARIKAGTFWPDPAVPPRLRVVGGTDWSGAPARRGGNSLCNVRDGVS